MNNIFAIQNLLARFANSFDLKDWSALAACLTAQVYTDYSDLRGTPPAMLAAAEYVRLRQEALAPLITHHLLGNLEIELSAPDTAVCRASMLIWRVEHGAQPAVLSETADEFHTHCLYIFDLTCEHDVWKIYGITQKVLWNRGKAKIHAGAAS